eukprot:2925076-Rhodomonas_salina.1
MLPARPPRARASLPDLGSGKSVDTERLMAELRVESGPSGRPQAAQQSSTLPARPPRARASLPDLASGRVVDKERLMAELRGEAGSSDQSAPASDEAAGKREHKPGRGTRYSL